MNFSNFPFEELPFIVLVLLIAFTVHEFAHAYSAYKFGDDTAYREGRVSLNPMVHLDWLGFILIIIAGFGWAKPVPVRASRFKNPRVMSVIVSLVGPLSNLVLGIISIIAFVILAKTGLLYAGSDGVTNALVLFFGLMIQYNFLLFVFNLIPLPPLDGYRIVSEFLPLRTRYKLDQNAHWGSIIFLLIVFIPPLRAVTITPVLMLGQNMSESIMTFFISIL
ncbi:MAG: site-2 protease family protein [Candidatus Pristimantibacillus lignocellulolyticus]|uniref:Site-2 protease family protein n=1 Tax=Candidatus Pristimantibacillus lignocellulolyticus TaxID=2994561 RepID=A0A9J6ZE71_9BACL|nr:MAG: site-2 protease family protein [Candidatus Pristimantibacillus lignocellulolyticus]